ncbi:LysM peptidoglycan-binding domain-containing protein [Candidatus Saccharibacteria bacterium]|nr:LysM peptidoglycan-binding domain-containing protein [Candidatus Saccharibacteria bacterium]
MIKKNSNRFKFLRHNWPYILAIGAVFSVAFFGSKDKQILQEGNMDMQSIVSSNYQVSADQVSQFYMVALMANTMDLASAGLTETNYTTVSILQQNSQTTDETGKISKPISVSVPVASRGISSYVVQDGDTMDSIAAKFGLTTDQIRWSNNLGTVTINPGQTLYIPSVPGIIYKVKNGETVESIASKYGSSTEEIIAVNDLENNTNLNSDMTIIIPSGVLPETERPEYVAPVTYSSSSASSSYRFTASYSSGNKYAYGWCTWYAWERRQDLPSNLGNANTWASMAAAAGFNVNRTPSAGAVFQRGGGLGHVGIVEEVYADGSVRVTDMNGIAGWGRVGETVWSAAEAAGYMYIHGR